MRRMFRMKGEMIKKSRLKRPFQSTFLHPLLVLGHTLNNSHILAVIFFILHHDLLVCVGLSTVIYRLSF